MKNKYRHSSIRMTGSNNNGFNKNSTTVINQSHWLQRQIIINSKNFFLLPDSPFLQHTYPPTVITTHRFNGFASSNLNGCTQ